MRSGSVLIMSVMSHKKSRATLSNRLKNSTQIIGVRQLDIGLFACIKTRSGEITSRQGGSPSASFANGEHHKSLIVLTALVVGGIQLGLKAFDSGVATAQQSQTAEMIKTRHSL